METTKSIEDVLNTMSEIIESLKKHGFENNIIENMIKNAWYELHLIKLEDKKKEAV